MFGIFITQSLQYFSFIYLFNNALITFYNTYIGIIKTFMAKNPEVGQSQTDRTLSRHVHHCATIAFKHSK